MIKTYSTKQEILCAISSAPVSPTRRFKLDGALASPPELKMTEVIVFSLCLCPYFVVNFVSYFTLRINLKVLAVLTILSLFLYSCSTPCREWVYEEIPASSPCYASSQLSLAGSSTPCPLRVLFVRTVTGTRMYVDLLQLQVAPHLSDPTKALITIITNDKTYPISAYRFEGGQRMLLPSEAADELIALLLNGQSFAIRIGSYQSDVIPINFEKHRNMLQ